MLNISKDGGFYLEGKLISTKDTKDINEYLMQLLGFYTSLEEGVNIEELTHAMFGLKKFIKGYFSEDYEVIRAFSLSTKLDKKYKAIRFYKSFKIESDELLIENEFLYVLPEVSFEEAKGDEVGYDKLGDLPIIIDENISLSHKELDIKLKSKFTLLDILSCLFDEVSACIKSGSIFTVV